MKVLAGCLALWLGCASAGELPTASELRGLDASSVYLNRWSALQMLNAPVRGAAGEPVGHVADILVGDDGQVHTLLVELGGLFDVGDAHAGVPWPDVRLAPGLAFVQVPAESLNSGMYSLFSGAAPIAHAATPAGEWRLRELVGDFVALLDVPRYGLVRDVLFDDRGAARAVIVSRGNGAWGAAGAYAYPWAGYRANAAGAYVLPYRSTNTLAFQRFDYARLASLSALAGGERSASAGSTARRSPDAVPLFGRTEASQDKRDIFRWLDRDGDRAISRAEAAWRPHFAASFEQADTSRDGRIDVEEFARVPLTALRR